MLEEVHQERNSEELRGTGRAPLPSVTLTPKAVQRIRELRQKEGLSEQHGLRIGVVGGGCSGFQYSLNFDTAKEGDAIIAFDGVQVFVDEMSLQHIDGTTLDYVEGLHGAGFKFDNPRATRTCGCGSSFSA